MDVGKQNTFNIFLIMRGFSIIKNLKVTTTSKTKKTLVVIKSPFHYKLPKHHISYQFFQHRISFLIHYKIAAKVTSIIKTSLLTSKVHRSRSTKLSFLQI